MYNSVSCFIIPAFRRCFPTPPLPRKWFSGLSRKRALASRCLSMDYWGFQASCHNIVPRCVVYRALHLPLEHRFMMRYVDKGTCLSCHVRSLFMAMPILFFSQTCPLLFRCLCFGSQLTDIALVRLTASWCWPHWKPRDCSHGFEFLEAWISALFVSCPSLARFETLNFKKINRSSKYLCQEYPIGIVRNNAGPYRHYGSTLL